MSRYGHTFRHVSAALIVFFILWSGVLSLFAYLHFTNLYETLASLYGEQFFLLSTSLLLSLIAVIVYLLLSLRRNARVLASQMTEELALSKEQFQVLYENGPVPYLVLSKDNIIVRPNKAALRLYEQTAAELEGRPFFDLVAADDAQFPLQLAEKVRRNIPLQNIEIEIKTGGGPLKWALMSVFPVGNVGRKGSGALVTLVDITERKAIDRIKSEFVSLAAHQLRTPLSTIKWYAEMLTKTELTEKQKAYLTGIYAGNKQLISLAKTLLEVSRIEMGAVIIKPKEALVSEIATTQLEPFKPQIERKEIILVKKFIEPLPSIITDPRLLGIVLENLFSNAVKYTEERGTITITIKEEQGGVRVLVTDTGCGIPADVQNRIFSKLFRADNVRGFKGMGLGLYMTKSLTELLGGTISFTSVAGEGTTFILFLPSRAPVRGPGKE